MHAVKWEQHVNGGIVNQLSFGHGASGLEQLLAQYAQAASNSAADSRRKECALEGCPLRPTHGVKRSRHGTYCGQHAAEDMVAIAKLPCVVGICSRVPYYAADADKMAEFCTQHAAEDMVNVRSKKCSQQGCSRQPTYGMQGMKPERCSQHALEGMIDIYAKRCANQSCSRIRSFGIEGTRNPQYCSQHALKGMVDVVNKRCASEGCFKGPCFGVEGSGKAEFCVQHAAKGMVDVRNKRCGRQGCTKHRSYGVEGDTRAVFCSQHADPGMVNVVRRKCFSQGCSKARTHGVEGTRKAQYCEQHGVERRMVDVRLKKCADKGCLKKPSHGREGAKSAVFCAQHAEEGMVNMFAKKVAAESCPKQAIPPPRSVCSSSSSSGSSIQALPAKVEEAVVSSFHIERCSRQGCLQYPAYDVNGKRQGELCADHEREEVASFLSPTHSSRNSDAVGRADAGAGAARIACSVRRIKKRTNQGVAQSDSTPTRGGDGVGQSKRTRAVPPRAPIQSSQNVGGVNLMPRLWVGMNMPTNAVSFPTLPTG